ncbi:MAG: hypothetical protein QOD83_986 [Solirubrobacteraceae bacterium]|nr:hypothetical protein [Solirubrobacteraceae bacterium]
MAKEAHIADWREAFTYGHAEAKGVDQMLKAWPTVAELVLRGQYGVRALEHALIALEGSSDRIAPSAFAARLQALLQRSDWTAWRP